jgi:hypothetical protein
LQGCRRDPFDGSTDEEESAPVGRHRRGGGRGDGGRREGERGPTRVREQEKEEKGRGEGGTKGEQDVGVAEAEVAARGEEGLRVAVQEGVEGAGDEGEGRVHGARQQSDAVHGQVVGERRDEAPADQFRRCWRGDGFGGHGHEVRGRGDR